MGRRKRVVLLIFSLIFVFSSIFFPYDIFMKYSEGMIVSTDELDNMLNNNFFVTTNVVNVSADDGNKFNEYIINYKLFDLFSIKKLKVNVIDPDRYFAGGESIGFSLKSKGVVLIGGNYIISENSIEHPYEKSGLKPGDIITHIDNIEISDVSDISKILSNYTSGEIKLKVNRSGQVIYTTIIPALDKESKTYKLGLWVKEDAVGIGTLTFVNATTNRFGSLGHSINDSDTNECIDVSGGNIFNGRILGVKKGTNGKAGELIGTFNKDKKIGSVDKNCEYGVYGFVDDSEMFTVNKTSIPIGGRLSATPGKATILSCIDGINVEEFDIEIIKTNFQNSCNEKSMVIRVIDKDLISRTGGIVQGMSGSPIIQNGKLVGAVTHVFVNDSTKGFGIYVDWMLEQ